MAVYTVLDAKVISGILKAYDLGTLQRFEPVSSGIENTNYFVWSESEKHAVSQWVLTIFENLPEASLPFFNALTCHLSQKGFAVPAPQKMKNGQLVFSIQSVETKHGVLVPKLKGAAVEFPDIALCRNIASYTAKMHVALNDFEIIQNMPHSLEWCERLVKVLRPLMPQNDGLLLMRALERYQDYQALIDSCVQGVVHGDLFRDNVLFESREITGAIDFYNAGKTAFLFDLAVIANDWAVNFEKLPSLFSTNECAVKDIRPEDIYDEQKLSALVHAYGSVKLISEIEHEAWPRLLELAAFRFWLSRLKTKYLQGYQQNAQAGEVIKSPDAMKAIMLAAMAR